MELNGKVAIVTGAGQGLGEATARALSEKGALTICADIQLEKVQRVAAAIHETGCASDSIQFDVRDPESVEQAVQIVLDRYGRIDILVNCAGIDHTLPIEELTIEQWDQVIDVNLRGPFLMAKYILPVMYAQQSGQIVNIASTAAKRTWANASAYHASKWGLVGLSHALHVEAREHNVRVSTVVPGGMRTPFILERFPDTDPANLQDPKSVAQTIVFVLSMPDESVIPEVMVLPLRETSWP